MKNLIVFVFLAWLVYVFAIEPYESSTTPAGHVVRPAAVNTIAIPPTITPTIVTQTILKPYPKDCSTLTQWIHGQDYEEPHWAIDIAGGKGAYIYAPISGNVQLSVDWWGNSVLKIKNDSTSVEMLHGDWFNLTYVEQGQHIGYEGNNGLVYDKQGNRCEAGARCGYHTHIASWINGQHFDPNQYVEWQGECLFANPTNLP